MSKLYYSDHGFVIPTICEEVTGCRKAAKILTILGTSAPAQLFFLARPHSVQVPPLRVFVNNHQLPPVLFGGGIPAFAWYELNIPAGILTEGQNRVEFWSEGDGMNAWTLALDCTPAENPGSFVSLDSGMNWSSQQLGRFSRNQGEYLVRIRMQEGEDLEPPIWVDEDFSHPRLAEIRSLLPSEVFSASNILDKIRILSSWTAQSWEYCSSAYASLYTPWDAATILAWGKAEQGQNGQRPIVMCVHYAITFITACQALGIHARASAFTEAINGFNGHFAAEVWLPDLQKWIFVDPNIDAIFYDNGQPLSVAEMHKFGPNLSPYVVFGPGYTYQIRNPSIAEFMKIYLNGRFMKLRGLWPRADFLSHPELTPPGHGSLAYCETYFVWEPDENLRMFPYFGDPEYFSVGPDSFCHD